MSSLICVSQPTCSDSWPLTCYLLSALWKSFFFFPSAGIELWKQRAEACSNSLGSVVRLFNPFHPRLTLMSRARPLQTGHQHTQTHTNTHEPLHVWAARSLPQAMQYSHCFGALQLTFDLIALWLLSPFFPFLLLLLYRSQREHRWQWAWKTIKKTPWREVRVLQTGPLSRFVTHLHPNMDKRTHTHTESQEILQNIIHSCKHTNSPTSPKYTLASNKPLHRLSG